MKHIAHVQLGALSETPQGKLPSRQVSVWVWNSGMRFGLELESEQLMKSHE